MGRDPLLVWFAAGEPILAPDERERIAAEIRANPMRHRLRSERFWKSPDGGPKPSPPPVQLDSHLLRMRNWMRERDSNLSPHLTRGA